MDLLLFLFIGMVLQFGLHKLLARPLCEQCGAKAMPNQTSSMIRAWHERDSWERRYYALANGSEPCCTQWATCMRPCTPRGEKIAEGRSHAANETEQK